MPAQYGQTYDPQEEPTPRGGWFQRHDRPYPERMDRAFRWAAVLAAVCADIGFVAYMSALSITGLTASAVATAIAVGALPAAMAYGFTRGLGLILVGLYSTFRDGSEVTLDLHAVCHDIRLRRTWIVLLEGALLLTALVTAAWGLILFARHGEAFGAVVFAVIAAMIYWPPIRRWIAAGQTRG